MTFDSFMRAFCLALGMAALLAVGAVLGMEFDPNGEYCASRTHLFPQDCTYEQSSDRPGDEVCR